MENPLNRNHGNFFVPFLAITILGFALRLPRLSQRPMHTDEAVHAIKFGSLLEDNYYRYDPNEYHGPTLNYLTLIPAWLASTKRITETNETMLRIVPVFFGMFLILGLVLLGDGLSRPVVLYAGLFTAVSPAMVFYSRYYIQEMLLVSFTFGAIVSGYLYVRSKRIGWAFCTGIFLGFMHATKETCVIAFGAMLLALLLTVIIKIRQKGPHPHFSYKMNPWHVLTIIAAAFTVSALFYSSFLTHPRGILDSFLTFKTYLQRAGHNGFHSHPWFYYFKLLIGSKHSGRPFWSEAFIVLLSGVGLIVASRSTQHRNIDPSLHRFIAFYAIIMAVIYSAIPYKTPWALLGFYHGMILLSAIGVSLLLNIKLKKYLRPVFILFIIAGVGTLFIQSYISNYKVEADPSNPYVYAHTVKDIYKITERVNEIAEIHPNGKNMFIEVICPGDDYWPLPWYLRSFPNVGWWNAVDFSIPAAPLILASPRVESDILKKLYDLPSPGEKNLYLPLFESYTELRPQIELRGYVIKGLWDRYLQSKEL